MGLSKAEMVRNTGFYIELVSVSYALAFKHRGNVKHLVAEPLLIEVTEKFNLDDHPERFHAWYLESAEIHVESVFVKKVRDALLY